MYNFPPNVKASMEKTVAPIAVYQFLDKRVRTLIVSAGFLKMFNLKSHEEGYYVMDNDMYRDTHPDDIPRIASEAVRFATGEIPVYKVIYRSRVNGEYHIIHAQGEHVTAENGERIAYVWYFDEGLYSDIASTTGGIELGYDTALKESSNRHYFDFLTGMPLIKYFLSLSEAGVRIAIEQGRRPVMLYVDLCGITDFNRRFGFEEGDNLIKALAALLISQFSNDNCCRQGQDHFAVFTDDHDLDNRLRTLVENSKSINGGRNVPIRIGVYVYRDGENNPRTASERAKVAGDAARDLPDPAIKYYDETLHLQTERVRYIIDNIDKAIAEKWIKVYYQPIVRSANGRVCNEEALSRWIDPDNGPLTPDEFIPTLEDQKLIYKLDLFVVDQVLEKLKIQAQRGLFTVPTSINLSRADFDSCDIVEEIRQRVDDSGIGRDKINIEITESIIGSDFDFMKSQIERFKALGFRVWMDDFGRGYSSLDLLQELHFDLIKFDLHFMRMFSKNNKTKIILTELMKMASGLGIETVVEGVETEEQVQFLKEIGCTKMQGFFFCRPIPVETIFERYEKGAQIGFENPDETPYYSSIGSINLYDIASVNKEDATLSQYFNTVPMVIVEVDGKNVSIIRNNSSCRAFLDQVHEDFRRGELYPYPQKGTIFSAEFAKAIRQCTHDGARQFVNARMPDGAIAHLYLKRIAKNPVTGKIAFVGILLEYTDFSEVSFDSEEQIPTDTFVYSLASDYTFLYYVNLDNEHFVEYRPNEKNGELSVVRHGMNFFSEVRKDAPGSVYKEDLQKVLTQLTKENVMQTLATDNAFTLTYRLVIDGKPKYVSLKASKLGNFSNRVIIGVNNVQAQMEVQEAYERAKEEQMTIARISALSVDYICIYTVDPVTDHYVEYSTSKEYAGLGISKSGDHFFEDAYKNAEEVIDPDDVDRVRSLLIKEKILEGIAKTGLYSFNYRLLLDGESIHVSLKAALVKEGDSNQLIIGISNINDQVKRDREYAYNLSMAKIRADIDALTGVKNRHAYLDFEEKLNASIKEKKNYPFAVTVFDVNDLKTVNDEHGHHEGDRLIRDAAALICNKFKHSPVFRIGGDEFVAVSSGQDYELIDSILKDFDKTNTLNAKDGKVVVSFGMSRYDGDASVDDVFDRADRNMYEYKKSIKAKFKSAK